MTYELPPELQTEEGRREFFRQARRKLKDDAGGRGLFSQRVANGEPALTEVIRKAGIQPE